MGRKRVKKQYYKIIQDLGIYDQRILGYYGFKNKPETGQEIPVGEKKKKLKIKHINETDKIIEVE